MPTTNARGHKIPTLAETSITRETIFQEFGESIRDVVPVANTTARTQLISDLNTAGEGVSSARPVYVYRHDAPGLHRLEYSVDGTTWIPASGVLQFASLAAATSWATTNNAYLTAGDIARIAGVNYRWTGTTWQPLPKQEWVGSVQCPATGGGGSSPLFWSDLIDVTFPTGMFAAAPFVFCQTVGPSGQVQFGGLVEQITAAGCKVRGIRIAAAPNSLFSVLVQAIEL